ncbi:MAG: cation-translocating P-type ATPase, partial [Bacteroidota bacterium]
APLQVKEGDMLQVLEGEAIPTDGKVISGEGLIDRSMLTGESKPEEIGPESDLTGGTLLIQGHLQMVVTAVGGETTLSKIIELVKKAQRDKPAIQQLADRISSVFVPVVLGIATLTFLLSWLVFDIGFGPSIMHSIAVMVISCPCAMGLATPTAVVVGLGRATRNGMLVKGGRTLETFSKVEHVVFDKTGTLTTGKFQLEHIEAIDEPLAEVQAALLGLEIHSQHPLAKSLVTALEGIKPVAFESVREIKGLGMHGTDAAGNEFQLGSWRLVQHLDISRSHSLYLLKNDKLVAWVDMGDELRPGALETVRELQKAGIRVSLLSGDRQSVCEKVAAQLGIEDVYAEQLPDEKLARIEEWSGQSMTAMVGDGINDAPALARAGIGISLGDATDIARQSSEIVLMDGRLDRLSSLLGIARETVKTIRQNLFWAFFYNILAIPMAALGFLRPIIGTATMALSDVIVIGNSLRLRTKRILT